MAGHSILYLGRDEFAPDFLETLEQSPACERLTRSDSMQVPEHGEPADIARTVLFLLRDAGYVTGQVIAVDGGRSL